MRNSFIVVALSIASSLSVSGQGNESRNAQNSADEAAIRALLQKCIEGWNKGSGEAFAAQFAEDSDFVSANGMHLKGRKQNASHHQQIFDTFFKGTRLWAQVKSVRFLGPDVALLHTHGTILKPGESDASPEPVSTQTLTVSKHGNEWLVDAYQNTPIQRQGGQTPKP